MKTTSKISTALCIVAMLSACGGTQKTQQIEGIYVNQRENEFDHIRDTIRITANDKGSFDVTQSTWSAAKQDDPERPINKVAGQWNNNSGSKTVVAELQESDHTLRITEPATGETRIISFSGDGKILMDRSEKQERQYYKTPK